MWIEIKFVVDAAGFRVQWKPLWRHWLLGGASACALIAASSSAGAGTRWFPPSYPSVQAAVAAQQAAAQNAAKAAQQAQQSILNARQAIQNAQSVQIGERNLYLNNPGALKDPRFPKDDIKLGIVKDGLNADGLVPSSTVPWTNATIATPPLVNPGPEFSDGGRTVVVVEQYAQRAIAQWDKFNVGANTTVKFLHKDSATASNYVEHPTWTILNRVLGDVAPSQILGKIVSPGNVLVINQNGIIFGPSAQINVHSLIASSLDVGQNGMSRQTRDDNFLASGIAADATKAAFSSYRNQRSTAAGEDGDIRVMKGAQITTNIVTPDEPGYIYLFGANVYNSGTLTSPSGEVAMVAAHSINLLPKFYDPGHDYTNTAGANSERAVDIRGTGFGITPYGTETAASRYRNYFKEEPDGKGGTKLVHIFTGQVENESDGLIVTPRGSTILVGDDVRVGGVISADTSITRNSQVFIDAVTKVDLSGVISIQPFENGETLPIILASSTNTSSSVNAFSPASVTVSAHHITMGSNSLISAPGSSVSLSGNSNNYQLSQNLSLVGGDPSQQVLLKSGATIDVSGLQDVQLGANYNIIAYNPRGTEFADQPLQKNGSLFGSTLYIDIRDTGTREDGTTWVGTPLGDASGFVSLVGRSISQLLTAAGSVSLKTNLAASTGGRVIVENGATVNVAGGYVTYLPGFVPRTLLISSDGRLVDINEADPSLTYVGFAGDFVVNHERWGVTETYLGPTPRRYEGGYREGRDAGTITVESQDPQLYGTFQFGSLAGPRQVASGTAASGTTNGRPSQVSSNELPFQGGLYLKTPQNLVVADGEYDGSSYFSSSSAYVISAKLLSGYKLSLVSLSGNDLYIPAGNTVSLAPGGQFSAKTPGAIDIEGSIVARGGKISLTTDAHSSDFRGSSFATSNTVTQQSDIYIGGKLDVSGQWVNDSAVPLEARSGPGYINGGSITLKTFDADAEEGGALSGGGITGSILLAEGSLLDASSGGYIGYTGALKQSSGVASGKGGNITLATYQGEGFDADRQSNKPRPPDAAHPARLVLEGTLAAYGFSSGGTLTLVGSSFQIGGAPSADPNILTLSTSFFSTGGFSSYVLKSAADVGPFARGITLAANETVTLQQQNFASFDNYLDLATGTNLWGFARLETLSADLRKPINLTFASGNTTLMPGSHIAADAGAAITITTGVYELPLKDGKAQQPKIDASTALLLQGSITAHGGSLYVQSPNIWIGSEANIDLSGTFIANSRFGYASGASASGRLLAGGTATFDTGLGSSTRVDTTGVLGFVIAEKGAVINVSGANAVITERIGRANAPQSGVFTDVASWSDGGTVSFNTKTFLWGGTFLADAGAPQGNRGRINLGGNEVALQQNNTSGFRIDSGALFGSAYVAAAIEGLKSTLNPTSANVVGANGTLINSLAPVVAAVDNLAAFDTVYLYGGTYVGSGGLGFLTAETPYAPGVIDAAVNSTTKRAPITLYGGGAVAGDGVQLALSVTNALFLEASEFRIGSAARGDALSGNVRFSGNYVMLAGNPPAGAGNEYANGATKLSIEARTSIDVQTAAFNGFGKVSFLSDGDIRLMAPPVNNGEKTDRNTDGLNEDVFYGNILAGGDLLFSARRIYPVSAVDFEIATQKPGGRIVFTAPAGTGIPATPLSAGGKLTVSAAYIEQGGNLFAPLGTITLGALTSADLSVNDRNASRNFVKALEVTLGPGSITSVSLNGQLVPYGQTEDDTNWFYNANTSPISVLPGKNVRLNGTNVSVTEAATIDLAGGGDLVAFEYIQGKGGTKDVLSNIVSTGSTTRTARTETAVYALIPSAPGQAQDPVGAYDIHFNSYLGDRTPSPGQQIYLSGGNGIAAGWYTLYPAHYAILPNALRVVTYGSTATSAVASGTTLTDGTQIIGGYFGQSSLGKQSSGTTLFAVQTNAVWRQYTETVTNTANSYFTAKAIHDGVTRFSLPIDGGRLSLSASISFELKNIPRSQAASILDENGKLLTGRGGELDLAAAKIAVVEAGAIGPSGFTLVDVSQLNKSGFESILIGGRRTEQAGGTLITAVATDVRVDLSSTEFAAPEIILVAGSQLQETATLALPVSSGGEPVLVRELTPNQGNVTVTSGSVVTATGSVSGPGRAYYLGQSLSDLATFLGGTYDSKTGEISGVQRTSLNLANYASAVGAGGLLLVSNDPSVSVTRRGLDPAKVNFSGGGVGLPAYAEDMNIGHVTVESGARISTASKGSLIASATGKTAAISIDSAAKLNVSRLVFQANNIGIGDGAPVNTPTAFAISRDLMTQLTAADSLTLAARTGNIDFYTTAGLEIGKDKKLQSLVLDAAALVGHDGRDVTIGVGGTLTLQNTGKGAVATEPVRGGFLALDVGDPATDTGKIVLGGGAMSIAGFAASGWQADQVYIGGAGSLTMGSMANGATPVNLTIVSPMLVVGGGSSGAAGTGTQFALTTLGDFVMVGGDSKTALGRDIGGNFQLNAARILLDRARIEASAGTVTLHGTGTGASGAVVLGEGSAINARGYAQTFYDVVKYTPGGKVVLTSDKGSVNIASSASVDVSSPYGNGGEIDIKAQQGTAAIDGTLKGSGSDGTLPGASVGTGGIFSLDIGGGLAGDLTNDAASSLDRLAVKLSDGGFTEEITVHTRKGSIVLGDVIQGATLKAKKIYLTADEKDPVRGRIQILQNATLDASGDSGGAIDLFARSVDIHGGLIAKATGAGKKGGSITIGTSGEAIVDANGRAYTHATYGYQLLASAGILNIGPTARIDLSGGPADASTAAGAGGTLNLRVPLIGEGIELNFAVVPNGSNFVGVKDLVVEAYGVWSTTDLSSGRYHFDGIIDAAGAFDSAGKAITGTNPDHIDFYGRTDPVTKVVSGTLVDFIQNALDGSNAAGGVYGQLGTIFNAPLPSSTMVHLRPGIDLRNPDTTINKGDITVASNWNLAAARLSKPSTIRIGFNNFNYFNTDTSEVEFFYRYGIEPGALTFQAARNLDIKASISDGFLHYQDYLNTLYLNNVVTGTSAWQALRPAPLPTAADANAASPKEVTSLSNSLASFDLFPALLNVIDTRTGEVKRVGMDSWSYRFTSGTDFDSANPGATRILQDGGDIVLSGRTSFLTSSLPTQIRSQVTSGQTVINIPTMVRTGTGSITMNSARDIKMVDDNALNTDPPGVVLTAGRNTALLPDAQITSTTVDGLTVLTILNPTGFVEPNIIAFATGGGTGNAGAVAELGKFTGPPTAAAFPELAGDIYMRAERDIIGRQNIVSNSTSQTTLFQFYSPWLMSQASGVLGAGAFAPLYADGTGQSFLYSQQSAWWIQFGRFNQGILSAGGDVTVIAGRDMREISISLPTTGRVSGGLTTLTPTGELNVPVTHLYESGDMTVRVGRNLFSGAFYEGSGTGTITVGGSVLSSWTGRVSNTNVAVSTVLAVDTGQLTLTAAGSINITNIINPAEIQRFPHPTGKSATVGIAETAMSTYGADSSIKLVSIGGDVTVDSVPLLFSNQPTQVEGRVTQTYPATFEITSFSGDITTPRAGMILTNAPSTTLDLFAYGDIDLRGGVTPGTRDANGNLLLFGRINAGASLIDLAANPYEPNMGTAAITTPVLAHADDTADKLYDHIYSLTGDIKGAGIIQIPRPVQVRAARDIVDLNLTAQNIRVTDVSTVSAGRDLYYTGLAIGGGLQIAGPGYLEVLAGRDLGPFLPVAADNPTNVQTQQGIVSSGNAASTIKSVFYTVADSSLDLVEYPVGNFTELNKIGIDNPQFVGLLDRFNNRVGQRNFLLPDEGASIVALFGVSKGINYDGVVARYLNPATSVAGASYLGSLQEFMTSLGITAADGDAAWAQWGNLSPQLQRMFVDRLFFQELALSTLEKAQPGYRIIDTMFPGGFGYTQNNLGGGPNGAPPSARVQTGDMNLLHATVQTVQGGDILMFGPGGQMIVGSVATEPNPALKLNNLGILTLSAGDISAFTDRSVLVNSSRIFTEFGGDITLWSSNGDIDAGRGSRTTVSLNRLQVTIDTDNYQRIDRTGLVTGAGIAVLKTAEDIKKGKVRLYAPAGTINAGDAGIRSSGDLILFANTVLNADNIKIGGSVTGIATSSAPSAPTLTSPTNSPTQNSRTTDTTPTGTTNTTSQPSIMLVEVVGYGGGDDAPGATAPATTGSTPAGNSGGNAPGTPAGNSSGAPGRPAEEPAKSKKDELEQVQ